MCIRDRFDAEYEPDNWRVVVNNVNFRRSLFYALDRKAAMLTAEPHNPERRISNTLTPKGFTTVNGIDFTQIGPLAEISNRDSFNSDEAKDVYKRQGFSKIFPHSAFV